MPTTRSILSIVFALFGLIVVPRLARAHDHWLEVDPFWSATPGRSKVYLFGGEQLEGPEPVHIKRRDRYARFRIVSAGGARDVLSELREDSQPMAILTGGRAGGTFVLALDALPRSIEIDAAKFQQYLLEERLVDALMWRAGKAQEDAPGRERYSRSLKAIIQVGAKLDDVAIKAVGQDLEIVPLVHPYSLAPGGSLSVQVLYQGRPLPGRAVVAANRFRSSIVKKTIRTDAKGIATFVIPRAGDWLIRLVHIEPVTGEDVDWRSFWSALTFSLPEPPPAAPKK